MSTYPDSVDETTDPTTGLIAVRALRKITDHLEALHVAQARSQGRSWQEIADDLGVTRQAVHQKHTHRE